jgi:hypothetical protein
MVKSASVNNVVNVRESKSFNNIFSYFFYTHGERHTCQQGGKYITRTVHHGERHTCQQGGKYITKTVT